MVEAENRSKLQSSVQFYSATPDSFEVRRDCFSTNLSLFCAVSKPKYLCPTNRNGKYCMYASCDHVGPEALGGFIEPPDGRSLRHRGH